MVTVFISIGSNLGDRLSYLQFALHALQRLPQSKVVAVSAVYETEPFAMADATPWFYNAVIQLETRLDASDLLKLCLAIESQAGRTRPQDPTVDPQSRTLDLDILFYGESILEEAGLCIPHPRLHQRAFVLVPLMELAPDWLHPTLSQSVEQLYFQLDNPEMVQVAGLLDESMVSQES